MLNGKYPIPLLENLFDAFPDAYFNIDAKSDSSVQPLVEIIKRKNYESRVCLTSFSATRLKKLRKLLPTVNTTRTRSEITKLKLGLPILNNSSDTFSYLEIPAYLFHKHNRFPIINEKTIKLLHAKKCKIFVWTINDKDSMNRLLDIGVDGLFTDKLSTLKKVLIDRGHWNNVHNTAKKV